MKKRMLTLASSIIVLTGILGGCAAPAAQAASSGTVQDTSSAATSSAPVKPVKITLWHSMSDDAGALMDTLVSDFNNGVGKEKGIEVESIFQGAYSDSTTKLRTILQNDQHSQLPDVMQIDATGIVDYQATEYKYTVDDALKADSAYDISQILEIPLVNWNYNNVQLGMPFSSSTTVMYYNKTMLDASGITQAPTTFQEIIDAAAKLPEKTADGQDITAYASVPNSPSIANWVGQIKGKDINSSYVVDNQNGRSASATKLVCDTEGTLSTFLTEWKKMYDAKALLNQSDSLSDLFLAGQLTFLTSSSSNLNTLLTMVGDKFELGCAYLPRVNADANFGATVSGSGMFMFNKGDDAQTAAAWEFVKYLASPLVQAQFSTGTGYFPANKASYETEMYKSYVANYPQLEVGVNQVNETSADMVGITVGPSWDFYMEIQNQVSSQLDSGASADEMVASLAASLNGILDQYNKSNS
ncbi:MAG: extracellular solute-binding protein [Acetanaerobacterium sp.]